MKIKEIGTNTFVAIAAAIVAFLIDIYFARWIYRDYQYIAKGIMGITLLVLLFRYILSYKITSALGGLKFIGLVAFSAVIGYWALREVIDVIVYLVRL